MLNRLARFISKLLSIILSFLVTNNNGQVISWASAGKMGFKGSKKNTPYAAQMAASDCAKVAYELGMRKAEVFVKGQVQDENLQSELYRMLVLK